MIKYFSVIALVLCGIILLAGCEPSGKKISVVDAFHYKYDPSKYYRVQMGDSLYLIAWSLKQDYKELAALNGLTPPYRIRVGQWLLIRGNIHGAQKPLNQHAIKSTLDKSIINTWSWPAAGHIISEFSAAPYGHKGLDIAGVRGEFVHSVANGVVVYSGAGVRGYGNLIIVKHNKDFLSAYAFNQRNLAKEGMKVRAGQKIATMGRNNAGKTLLHFELRLNGKPVDPKSYFRK